MVNKYITIDFKQLIKLENKIFKIKMKLKTICYTKK